MSAIRLPVSHPEQALPPPSTIHVQYTAVISTTRLFVCTSSDIVDEKFQPSETVGLGTGSLGASSVSSGSDSQFYTIATKCKRVRCFDNNILTQRMLLCAFVPVYWQRRRSPSPLSFSLRSRALPSIYPPDYHQESQMNACQNHNPPSTPPRRINIVPNGWPLPALSGFHRAPVKYVKSCMGRQHPPRQCRGTTKHTTHGSKRVVTTKR